MKLVFIHGPVASGKYTIGKELANLTGFPLFHNHLTVDLVCTLFDFGSPPFVELREAIWLKSFSEAAKAGISLIFTFAPEKTVRQVFIAQTIRVIEHQGGQVFFVELQCPEDGVERRIEDQSRAKFGKLRSVTEYRRLRQEGVFSSPLLPDSHIRIDTSLVEPAEAAHQIAVAIG
ncbi:MAG: shikimate kinase [Proteobacteria bacterium]|jgi:hypothetical protein|nr:shikimate kinase [Pseudomonadota bacterium]